MALAGDVAMSSQAASGSKGAGRRSSSPSALAASTTRRCLRVELVNAASEQ
jgi:hypothetical protein